MNDIMQPSSTDNIEPLARTVCERDLRRAGTPEGELTAAVDKYWHCVAAQIESGHIDDRNELIPQTLENGLSAYRDWCKRHPPYQDS